MASSSSKQASGSSGSHLQFKPKTMAIPYDSFEVQIESSVDFASLARNGMNMNALMVAQQMFPYFEMLNGPTYLTLVKEFWVRAEVYDLEAAKAEELQAVTKDSSLRGKTRKEMGLKPFRQTEVRSAVMGIPITITEEVIAKACKVAPTGKLLWNVSRSHPLLESFKNVVLNGNLANKLVDIDGHHRMLLKFMTECWSYISLLPLTKSTFPNTSCTIYAGLSKKGSEAQESRFPMEDCCPRSLLKASCWKP